MYLKGSNWNMRRRQRKWVGNWFYVAILLLAILAVVYVNEFVIPTVPPPFIPSPTPTREPESFIVEAETLFNEGKFLPSIEAYKKAILADPGNPINYVALARVQVFAGKYEEALTSTSNAILLSPDNAVAHGIRGWALTLEGNYTDAQVAIQTSLDLDPTNGITHAYAAFLYGNLLQNNLGTRDIIDQASEASNVALSLAPNAIESHWARGFILEITDNREEAISEYQAAININSKIPALHLDLGRTYYALDLVDQAEKEYTQANTLNPADPKPDLYLSSLYARLGEFARASQYAEQAVKDAPTDAYLRGNWAWCLYKDNDWAGSLVQFSLAINGGTADDGSVVAPLELTLDDPPLRFFYTYAILLAKSNLCGQAIPLAQRLMDKARSDEVAVYNAQWTIDTCATNVLTPQAQPTSTPTVNP